MYYIVLYTFADLSFMLSQYHWLYSALLSHFNLSLSHYCSTLGESGVGTKTTTPNSRLPDYALLYSAQL